MGPAADILGPGDADLQAVCSGVDALLRHGLKPATPRDKWTQYLPGRRTGPLDMLQVAPYVHHPPTPWDIMYILQQLDVHPRDIM